MNIMHGLPPVIAHNAKTLILGSMPGSASLQAGQYYAHPRNLFWQFMEAILHIPRSLAYLDRCHQLTEHNIALWDVISTCSRQGSLDADIISSSILTNDLSSLFVLHPTIDHICFNGSKAEHIFHTYIISDLGDNLPTLTFNRLPSTSPANAAMSFEVKLKKWQIIHR